MNEYGSRKANEITLEKRILIALNNNPTISREELLTKTGTDKKTLMEYLSKMKKKGLLIRVSYYLPTSENYKLEKVELS